MATTIYRSHRHELGTRRNGLIGWVTPALGCVALGCAEPRAEAVAPAAEVKEEPSVIEIQTYTAPQLAGVRAHNPDVQLSLGHDPALGDEPVLLVKYPAPTADPAGRDVWCDAENHDWSKGHAISVRVKPDHAAKFSVSFFDRNRVVYTHWAKLELDVWQTVRIALDEIRPNPYFQPPDAKLGNDIDVSEVAGIAFAPQDDGSGELALGKFVVTE